MDVTSNLSLPHIMPSQAQKHVTHNEALRMLDAIVQLAVIDRDLSVPPAEPSDGDRHIVADAATGAWEGKVGQVAVWQDGGWIFLAPRPGWLCLVIDEAVLAHWTGTEWADVTSSADELQDVSLLGIGTTADAVNPFAAKLNKALWTALTTGEGGDGDLRYTLSKQAPANVLSLLMQSDHSGRAEIGLVGDDDLCVKVSGDGSAWTEALRVSRLNGKVSLPQTGMLTDFAVSLLPDSGRFAGNSANGTTCGAFSFPSYISLYNGATAADAGKFITNNTDYGGTGGALPGDVRDLVDMIRSPAHRRYGVEFRVAQITMGSGTVTPITVASTDYHLAMFLAFGPRAPAMTFHTYLRALDAPVLWRAYAGQTIYKNGVAVEGNVMLAPEDGWASFTVDDSQDPYASLGYNPTPLTIHAAAEGDRLLIACPALMGGITSVDDNVGVIAGINRWLT